MRDSGWPSGQVCAIIQGSGAKNCVAHHYVSSDVDVIVGVGVVVHVAFHYVSADVDGDVVSHVAHHSSDYESADVDGEVVVGVVVHVAHPQHIIRS